MSYSVTFQQRELNGLLAWIEESAAEIGNALRRELDTAPLARLIVPGGGTARAILPALARQALAWDRVVVTLADERWVVGDHPDSNENLARRLLPAGAMRFVGLKTDAPDPWQAVTEVGARLADGPWPAAVAFLGMGEDGHIASLFPGHVAAVQADCRLYPSHRPDHDRLSLGPALLLDCRHIVLAAAGKAKLDALAEAGQKGSAADMPVRLLLNQRQARVTVLTTGQDL